MAKRVADRRILKLIRGFLAAGVTADGLVGPTDEGTPQGGPLSPLLSNLMLDVLDKELTRRGHCFVRYADDCNIYVRSRRAGERVMTSVTSFVTKRLQLRVNTAKSAATPWQLAAMGTPGCCVNCTSGSDEGCAPSPGSNGAMAGTGSGRWPDGACLAGSRHKPRAACTVLGGLLPVRPSISRSRTQIWPRSAFPS